MEEEKMQLKTKNEVFEEVLDKSKGGVNSRSLGSNGKTSSNGQGSYNNDTETMDDFLERL